jgi:AraC family transcriptional regulator, regulatory protein of adaptative response / methylated-DNA-[protein]-cysteine methyltransferase
MNDLLRASEDYSRIERAICYIEANTNRQPGLKEVADHIGLSEYHFQRLFIRWAGISPKRFLQFLTREHAKALLAHSASLLDTTYATGLSSPGRLHDLFIQTEAVTPGEYKSKGFGVSIAYGFCPSPFGECLIALTERGICFLGFIDGDRSSVFEEFRRSWPDASLIEDNDHTAQVIDRIFTPTQGNHLSLHLLGTNFQIKVWEALIRLPTRDVISYGTLAKKVGLVDGARAIGNAVAHNPIAYLIPCHRVLQGSGGFGGYRYGSLRKKAILGWEIAQGVIQSD